MTIENAAFYDDFVLYYDQVHQSRGPEHAFYENVISATDTVLEVACGSGTLTMTIQRACKEVVGLDLSSGMLDQARARLPGVEFVQADMRDFALGRTFDWVICPFNSLLHLPTCRDVASTLQCFAQHCSPGGRVVIDIFNLGRVEWDLRLDRHQLGTFKCDRTGRMVTAYETSRCDPSANLIHVNWFVEDSVSGDEVVAANYTITPLRLADLKREIQNAGFRLLRCFGDYDRSTYGQSANRVIVIAIKA